MTIAELRRRARRHGLLLQKDRRVPVDRWYIVRADINCVISNGSLTVPEIEVWLDDYEREEAERQ